MTPHIYYKTVVNDFITSGIVQGYPVFYLKCTCKNIIKFDFLKYESYSIYCDKCKRLSYELIYHNKSEITIRRFFNKKYEDVDLSDDAKNRLTNIVTGQHELSKMYLKNFCISNRNSIFVYRKETDNVEIRNIQTFSKEPFLYDKEAPQLAEQFLALIENDTSLYLTQIITKNQVFNAGESVEEKNEKKTLLLRFLVLLHLRRRSVKKLIYDKLVQFKLETRDNLILKDLKDIIFKEKFKTKDDDGQITYNEMVQHLHRKFMNATRNQEKLYENYKIKLLINESHIPLITSDNPIIRLDGVKKKNLLIPSKIYFPISPNHCILFIHPDENLNSIKRHLKKKKVRTLNYWQFTNASEFVISNIREIKENLIGFDIDPINNIPLCFFGFKSNISNNELPIFI